MCPVHWLYFIDSWYKVFDFILAKKIHATVTSKFSTWASFGPPCSLKNTGLELIHTDSTDAHMSSLGPLTRAAHTHKRTHACTCSHAHTLTHPHTRTETLTSHKHSFYISFFTGQASQISPTEWKSQLNLELWSVDVDVVVVSVIFEVEVDTDLSFSITVFLFCFPEIERLPPKVLICFSKIGFNGKIFFLLQLFCSTKKYWKTT